MTRAESDRKRKPNKKLDSSFYIENTHLKQALDFDIQSGSWNQSKIRGQGIVMIEINQLVFAIPVRSYIKHKASFILEKSLTDRAVKGMGLDYSKALLIKESKYISNDIF